MGFLDQNNSVIIDAVISDEGRRRLANGTFKITKFAIFDDEVDYTQFNLNHASGSAYSDLTILQSPVFEAFTNNTSVAKHFLLSIPRTNLLYLPILKINENFAQATKQHSIGAFVVAVDKDTEDSFLTVQGVIPGETANGGTYIRVDQGLDTTEISPNFTIDADLVETAYQIEIDNRFGKIISTNGTRAKVSFIDDDNIASYFLTLGTDLEFVQENQEKQSVPTQTIAGPRGTFIQLQVQASLDLNTSTFLFDQLGSTTTMTDKNGTSQTVNYLDTHIIIRGATTGYTLSVPVRFIKL